MTVQTSTFLPNPGTGAGDAGDAEGRNGGAFTNNVNANFYTVGNDSTNKNTFKSSMFLRFGLHDPDTGPAIPFHVDLNPRPIIRKVKLELQILDSRLDGASGGLRLGELERTFVGNKYVIGGFNAIDFPLKSDLPFPTGFADIVVLGTLEGDAFIPTSTPIIYDVIDAANGNIMQFSEGFPRIIPGTYDIFTNLVSIVQRFVDSSGYDLIQGSSMSFVLDGQDVPGDQVAEEYISFTSSTGHDPGGGFIGPVLTIEWEDGTIIVDAGPDATVDEGAITSLSGSVVFPDARPDPRRSLIADGSDDGMESVSATAIGIADEWTYMMWVNCSPGPGAGTFRPVFTLAFVPTGIFGKIQITTNTGLSTTHTHVAIKIHTSGGVIFKNMEWRNILPVDTWQHVVFTYSGTLDRVRLYLNGIDQGVATTVTTDDPGVIGDLDRIIQAPESNSFRGLLHQTALWSKVLSSEELAAIFDPLVILTNDFNGYQASAFLQHWHAYGFNLVAIGRDYGNAAILKDLFSDPLNQINANDITTDVPAAAIPPGSSSWSVDSGPPGEVVFGDESSPTSPLQINAAGNYTLRLSAQELSWVSFAFDTVDYIALLVEFHCPTADSDIVTRVEILSDVMARVSLDSDLHEGPQALSDVESRVVAESDVVSRVSIFSDLC